MVELAKIHNIDGSDAEGVYMSGEMYDKVRAELGHLRAENERLQFIVDAKTEKMNEWGEMIHELNGVASQRGAEAECLRAINAELLAVLQAVEWVETNEVLVGGGGNYEARCPWCGALGQNPSYWWKHKPDCPRQAAITKAKGRSDPEEAACPT